jgi:NAD(P)-dependent dehydrogenase (short-subunit alcohol dehydrogenase family)
VAKFGSAIHVLVNNAALFVFHSVETASAADWDRSAAVNIKAAGARPPAENRTSGRSIAKPSSENLKRIMLSDIRSVNYINTNRLKKSLIILWKYD